MELIPKPPLTNDEFLALVMRNLTTIRKYLDATPIVHGPPERVLSKTPHIPGALINTMSGTVTIGEHVFLGHDVMLIAGTHDYETTTGRERIYASPTEGFDIVIEDGAWIASRAIVLGPAHIGRNSVIGAGSIVRGNVEAGCLYAGNPARKIRTLVDAVSGICPGVGAAGAIPEQADRVDGRGPAFVVDGSGPV